MERRVRLAVGAFSWLLRPPPHCRSFRQGVGLNLIMFGPYEVHTTHATANHRAALRVRDRAVST